MSHYLTSTEALKQLCSRQSPHHMKEGFYKIAKGAVGLPASVAVGIKGYPFVLDAMKHILETDNLARFIQLMAAAGGTVADAGLFFYSLHQFPDGVTSLLDSVLSHSEDGNAYQRNGGLIYRSTRFDRLFGRRVVPIDKAADLQSIRQYDHVLANGVRFAGVDFYPNDHYSSKPTPTKKIKDPEAYMAKLQCELFDDRFPAETKGAKLISSLMNADPADPSMLRGVAEERKIVSSKEAKY